MDPKIQKLLESQLGSQPVSQPLRSTNFTQNSSLSSKPLRAQLIPNNFIESNPTSLTLTSLNKTKAQRRPISQEFVKNETQESVKNEKIRPQRLPYNEIIPPSISKV